MTQKFKVGDKVRILDVGMICGARNHGYLSGDIAEVVLICEDGSPYIPCKVNPECYPLVIEPSEIDFIELVDAKPTKKQRIEKLEERVDALCTIIESLRKALD